MVSAQRAITERIKREEADAAASGLRKVTAEKEAHTAGFGDPAPAASAQSAVQNGLPSDEPQHSEAGPSESHKVVPAKESSIATPVTPTRASLHPTATQRDASTDESASESADSEPIDSMQEDHDAQEIQPVTYSSTGEPGNADMNRSTGMCVCIV